MGRIGQAGKPAQSQAGQVAGLQNAVEGCTAAAEDDRQDGPLLHGAANDGVAALAGRLAGKTRRQAERQAHMHPKCHACTEKIWAAIRPANMVFYVGHCRGRQVAIDVAEGLAFLHTEVKIMHGDLKPV